MVIRSANESDASAIAALAGALVSIPDIDSVTEALKHILNDSLHAVFICDDEEAGIIGWIHVQKTVRLQSQGFAEIGGMSVRTDRQRSGIGSALLNAANEWAQRNSLDKLRVRCREDRLNALGFYLNMGFETIKEQLVLDRATTGEFKCPPTGHVRRAPSASP